MQIECKKDNDTVIILPKEKIDFVSAPDLEQVIDEQAQNAQKMIIDMEMVDYISSAGLRTILYADEIMSEKNGLVLHNVGINVKEILDISGFSGVIKIE